MVIVVGAVVVGLLAAIAEGETVVDAGLPGDGCTDVNTTELTTGGWLTLVAVW